MTRFRTLYRNTSGFWVEGVALEAHNAVEAVKKAYLKFDDGSRSEVTAMVAVPERSWKPQPIRTETVQKVVLGDVAPANSPGGAGVSPSEEA